MLEQGYDADRATCTTFGFDGSGSIGSRSIVKSRSIFPCFLWRAALLVHLSVCTKTTCTASPHGMRFQSGIQLCPENTPKTGHHALLHSFITHLHLHPSIYHGFDNRSMLEQGCNADRATCTTFGFDGSGSIGSRSIVKSRSIFPCFLWRAALLVHLSVCTKTTCTASPHCVRFQSGILLCPENTP